MDVNDVFDIFELTHSNNQNIPYVKYASKMRKKAFNNLFEKKSIVKLAFDTRRIDQETTYNPRRGLQSYHRSEPFVSDQMLNKISAFSKLSEILNELKLQYEKSPEWQDSYVRILCQAIDKGLRTIEADGDYSESQPSMASLSYLEELLHVRYRLTTDNLFKMANSELKNIILSKDESLTRGKISGAIIPSDVTKYSHEEMMMKMFASMAQIMMQSKSESDFSKLFDVKATVDNPNIERTITINIKDKFSEQIKEG